MKQTASYKQPVLKPVPLATKGIKNVWKVLYIWLAVGREWEICEDWTFTTKDGTKLFIPKGFIFNGASIPRFFRFILSPTGLLFIPSVIHDYAFVHDHVLRLTKKGKPTKHLNKAGKKKWDDMFYDLSMQVHGIRIVAQASKLALKLGGHITWKKNHGSEREKKIATAILKITGFFNVVIPFVTLGLILKGIFF